MCLSFCGIDPGGEKSNLRAAVTKTPGCSVIRIPDVYEDLSVHMNTKLTCEVGVPPGSRPWSITAVVTLGDQQVRQEREGAQGSG